MNPEPLPDRIDDLPLTEKAAGQITAAILGYGNSAHGLRLTLGGHDLGLWAVDHVQGGWNAKRGDYVPRASLYRIQAPIDPEPVDDDVAVWIKKHRDVYSPDEPGWGHHAYHVLDEALDDYRIHRVTGTPLDQEAGPHE